MNVDLDRLEAKERVQQQVAKEEDDGAMVIFTDGSLTDQGGGAAAVSKVESRGLGCASEGITNNELELLAIGLAIAQSQDNHEERNDTQKFTALAIFSDSQVALKRAHEPLTPTTMQYLAKSIKTFFSKLNDLPIQLYWTPGHEGIELNEKADEKAKQMAEKEARNQLTPYSLSKLLQVTRELFHLKTAKLQTGQKGLRTQPRKVADALALLEKGEAATIFHLRSGHSPLNSYLHRFKQHDTGNCDQCKIPESVAHFVLHCASYKQQQRYFRTRIKEEKIKVNPFSLPSLLNTPQVYPLLAEFVLETKRFQFLKKYATTKDGTPPASKTRRRRR